MVELALVDWGGIPDHDLAEVCARARRRAMQREKFSMATSADVLAAWREMGERAHRTAYQREQARIAAAIKAGNILPEPTLATASEATRNAAMVAFYRAAGLPIPGHLLSPEVVDPEGNR